MRIHAIQTLSRLMVGAMLLSFSVPTHASKDLKDEDAGGWFKPGCFQGKSNTGIFEAENRIKEEQLIREIKAHNAELNEIVDIVRFQETFESLDLRIKANRFTGLTVNVEELSKFYSLNGIGLRALGKIESILGYLSTHILETSSPLTPGSYGKGRLIPRSVAEILKENVHIVVPFFHQEVEQAEMVFVSFRADDEMSGMIHTFYVASLIKLVKARMPFMQ